MIGHTYLPEVITFNDRAYISSGGNITFNDTAGEAFPVSVIIIERYKRNTKYRNTVKTEDKTANVKQYRM